MKGKEQMMLVINRYVHILSYHSNLRQASLIKLPQGK